MALTFKKPPTPPDPPKVEYELLHFPGEIRKAALSGKVFGLYRTKWMIDSQYLITSQGSVIGFGPKEQLRIGELIADADGVLQYHSIQAEFNSDRSHLDREFRRFWELLERGCRINPDIEYRVYE